MNRTIINISCQVVNGPSGGYALNTYGTYSDGTKFGGVRIALEPEVDNKQKAEEYGKKLVDHIRNNQQ